MKRTGGNILGIKIFKQGTLIIEKDSIGTSAYMINSGLVEVSGVINNKKVVLAKLGKKEIFGEMGLIEDKPRSATITALEDTEVNEITRDEFNDLFQKNPRIILPIVKALFERLRIATSMATANSSENSSTSPFNKNITKEETYIVLTGESDIARETLNGKELTIRDFPFKVGRYSFRQNDILSDNDLAIKEDSPPYYISKNHFLIDKVDGNIVIVDRGSRLGIIANNKKFSGTYILTEENTNIIIGSSYSPFSFQISIKTEIKEKEIIKGTQSSEKFNFEKSDENFNYKL